MTATINAILILVGVVLPFLAVVARIESPEEHLSMRVMNAIIGLMLAVSFALAREMKPVRRKATIVGASLIWHVVSGSLLLWHEFQISARTT